MKKNYFALLFALCSFLSFSQTFNDFNNGAADGGLWSTAANWTLGVPQATHTIRTANGATSFVDANFTISRLQNQSSSAGDRIVNSSNGGILTIDPNTATLGNAIAIQNVSSSAVKFGLRGKINIQNSAGASAFSRITNANNIDNFIEFENTSVLTLTTPLEVFKATGTTASNKFNFNGKIEGSGNLRLAANAIATFGNSVSNSGYTGELVLLANSSLIVNTADDVIFYDGLKIQVNGDNASTTLNGANVFASGLVIGGTNTFTFNVNKNQSSMTNIIFQGDGTINMVVDNSVTNLTFANNSASSWSAGAKLNITGFQEGVIRFGTDNTGLTATQLAQIFVNGGSTPVALDANGYLVFQSSLSTNDFELDKNKRISYPTLATSKLDFNKPQDNVKVFDLTGKMILENKSKNQTEISINTLKQGLYLIVFDNKKVEKFIKQ